MPIIHHTPLVLASGSAIRAQMLKGAGLQFSVVPSNVDEDELKREMQDADRSDLAAALACAKALSVAKDYPDHLTIGADQLCVLGDHIFDKPGTVENAIEQLQQLAGNTHQQMSAVCVAKGNEVVWEHVASAKLTVRKLDLAEVETYIAEDEPLKSCGSYKYESLGRHLFETVHGNDDVIKGLPMQALIHQLHEMGAIALSA